ncbi:MAG: hypothetical protein ACI88H_002344 [Cocleimonas sp.]|jgi:hypothetical protein
MNKNIITTALLAIFTVLSVLPVTAKQKPQGPRGKPTTEAFEACSDKSAADSCSFTSSRGNASGTCKAPPHGDAPLACAPEGGRAT